MPTTYEFTELMDKRKAGVTQSGRTYTRVYQLITSARVSEADATLYVLDTQVLVTEGLDIGSEHPDDAGTVVKSVELDDVAADGCQWEVTVEWAYAIRGSLSPDPLTRPPEITWSQPRETVEFFFDFSSTPLPVINTAGEKFDDLPQRERGVLTCRYVVNVTESFWRSTIFPLMNFYDFVVNSEAFEIDGIDVDALHCRLEVENVEKITEGSTTYRRVAYVLTFRAGAPGLGSEGWREYYQSRGHRVITAVTIEGINVLAPIRDIDGQIVEQPWPLDTDGQALPSSDSTPALCGPFKPYEEVDFAPLGFA